MVQAFERVTEQVQVFLAAAQAEVVSLFSVAEVPVADVVVAVCAQVAEAHPVLVVVEPAACSHHTHKGSPCN
jgi:hypothetical protein